MLFDGNNRTNAIIEFLRSPLRILKDYIPPELEGLRDRFERLPLHDITHKRYDSITKFCKLHQVSCTEYPAEKFEPMYETMIDSLLQLKFSNVKIQVTIYEGLPYEEMIQIYSCINRNTTKMNDQELFACSFAGWTYSGVIHQESLNRVIQKYYDDMNEHEHIQMKETIPVLNLFEVLAGTQILLSTDYEFIPKLNMSTSDLDVVFYLFKIMYALEKKPTLEEINEFLSKLYFACEKLNTILLRMHDPDLFPSFKRFKFLKKNILLLSILYLMKNVAIERKQCELHKAFVYHSLLLELYTDSDVNPSDKEKDIFWYRNHGVHGKERLYSKLIEGTLEFPPLIEQDIRPLLNNVLRQNISISSTRKKVYWLEVLALTAFYNQQIPSITKQTTQDRDHIIPFSLRKKSSVDICRLGNKQLIPSKVNAARRTNPITDAWILENKLMYQEYPTEEEYKKIYSGTLNDVAFHGMCERREKRYIDHILSSWIYHT